MPNKVDRDVGSMEVEKFVETNDGEIAVRVYVANSSTSVDEFSIDTFTTNVSSPVEIGIGEWKAIGEISFSATYSNGVPTSAFVSSSGWDDLDMTGSGLEGPTASGETKDYPATPGIISFTLSASTSSADDSKVKSIAFYNRIYWGISTKTDTFLESDIEGLSNNSISNSKGRTITVDSTATNYIIYALPSRLGAVTFTVGGFEGGFQSPETVSVTNASGFTEDYYVYRSTNSGLGETIVVVS